MRQMTVLSTEPNEYETRIKEEGKEGGNFSKINQALPCFDFYKKLDSVKLSELRFAKNLKYKMVHPYLQWDNPPLPIKDIPKVEVNLKMCTLF